VSTPDVPETTAGSPSGAVNTKGKKVKKPSDSAKIRELKEQLQLANDSIVRLCIELSEQEDEIEQLQEKAHKLEIVVIERRGVIGYLEHKLEKEGKEDDTN
jgi:TolA-binding protein